MVTQIITKREILRRLATERERLASLGVAGIGLFGSFVRDQQDESSDVDLLVEFEEDQHTFDNFMEVSFFLEDLFGRRVEVVTPEALSPHLGPYILREVERVHVAA